MTKRRTSEVVAEIAAALMWGPKSRAEIAEVVGVDLKRAYVLDKHLEQFRASGCVYVSGFTERGREIYGWQPKPFEIPDAVRPVGAAKPASAPQAIGSPRYRANGVLVTVGGVQMTIRQATERLGLSKRVVAYRHRKGLPMTPGDLRKCPPSQA